jgi:uncharacterized protein GlcG (DUF336 family)
VLIVGGGVPIQANGELIGAIGCAARRAAFTTRNAPTQASPRLRRR